MTLLDLDQPIHDQIDAYRNDAAANVPSDVRDYYDGKHPPAATPEQQAALGDRAIRPYVENVIRQCVDTLASRLLFRRYLCEDGDAEQDWLEVFASTNHIRQQMVTNTVRVLVDGNNALSLSWSDVQARPVVHQEPWWDGEEGVYVEISDTGVEEWAVKEWTDRTKRKRRTVYLPDRILRYVQEGSGWQPLGDDAEQQWTKDTAGKDPLGVPVIHFGNTTTADSPYGQSSIEPILGLQDALNGTIFDIVAAQALNAFPIYTATGVAKGGEYTVGPGRRWETDNADAAFSVLAPGSMDAILDGYRAIRAAIANQFPISEHLISGGDWPSGMALQRAEGPMIGRVKMLGQTFAPSWVRLAHRAMEMHNTFGDGGLDEEQTIVVEYEPAEQLDEGTVTEIDLAKVQLYRDLANLPKPLMLKTGLVDEDTATEIQNAQAEQQEAFAMRLNSGAFGQDYEGQG